jgi:hypothetical protein
VKEGGQEKDECVGDPPDKKDEAEEGKGAEGAFEGGAFVEEGEHVVCRGGGGDRGWEGVVAKEQVQRVSEERGEIGVTPSRGS